MAAVLGWGAVYTLQSKLEIEWRQKGGGGKSGGCDRKWKSSEWPVERKEREEGEELEPHYQLHSRFPEHSIE